MERLEALEKAREFVQEVYGTKNERGYPKWAGSVHDLLVEIRRVAQFLMGEEE